MRLRHLTAAVTLTLVAAVGLAGCGSSSTGDPAGGAEPKVIDVTFKGEDVTPNGEVVQVSVGQPVELDVTADKPGEIHVHSDPEQEFEYDAGSTTIDVKPIETPGVVVIESHTLDKVLVKLQVR